MSAEGRWWRGLTGAATAFVALLTLASSLSPNVPWRNRVLSAFVPGAAEHVAHAAGVAGGLALLALSAGVLQGRRRASRAAVAVLAVLAAVHFVKGLDYEEAGLALALMVLLVAGSRAGRPSPRMLAGSAMVAALAAAYAVTLTALLISGHSPGVGGALARAAQTIATGAQPKWLDESGRLALHVLLGLAVLAGAAWVRGLIRPPRAMDGHDATEHARAAGIVARHGHDPLAPFVLRADKAFHFAHGGLLAYRTLGATAVVSGDPVGPPGAAPRIMGDFLTFARGHGWDVVVTAAGPDHLDAYRGLGLRTVQTGAEALVDPQGFSLEGRAIRKVRQSVHRVRRRGWSIDVVEAPALTAEIVAELEHAEVAWQAAHERRDGFAMSMDRLWGAPEDARDVYALARSPEGELRAFLRFVAYADGLSLDATRRLGDEPNGLTEALVVAVLEHAKAAGLRQVSLNFAGFAHVMAADALVSRTQRVLRFVLRRLHGQFQLERLVQFNDKFFPEWRPRFLVYTGQTRLPLAALRVLQAESYVPCPRARAPRSAWRPLPRPIEAPAPAAAVTATRSV